MRALGWGLLLICFGIIGCGPDIRAECEEQVQCAGGNDKDIDACVAVQEVLEDYLAELECDDEYDAYITCSAPYTKCKKTPTGEMCMTDADCSSDDACSAGQCVSSSFGMDA